MKKAPPEDELETWVAVETAKPLEESLAPDDEQAQVSIQRVRIVPRTLEIEFLEPLFQSSGFMDVDDKSEGRVSQKDVSYAFCGQA